ncbi:MAG: ECF transporter S component, partial [Lachnospiraceae bacterium]|nr:ECF transporter S component [Lachnospiraceae bacterium]
MKKSIYIALITILCILLNLAGKEMAIQSNLPLWLDSFGTVLAAYLLGPVSGGAVGFFSNITFGMFRPTSFVYALTSLAIGISVGLLARKKLMKSFFGMMTVSTVVTCISLVISTPLNVILYNGMTGNLWGDNVIEFLLEQEAPPWLAYILGEFYIDFSDKVATLGLLFLCIWGRGWILGEGVDRSNLYPIRRIDDEENVEANKIAVDSKSIKTLFALFALGLTVFFANSFPSEAAGRDFYSYVQTVYSSEEGLLG